MSRERRIPPKCLKAPIRRRGWYGQCGAGREKGREPKQFVYYTRAPIARRPPARIRRWLVNRLTKRPPDKGAFRCFADYSAGTFAASSDAMCQMRQHFFGQICGSWRSGRHRRDRRDARPVSCWRSISDELRLPLRVCQAQSHGSSLTKSSARLAGRRHGHAAGHALAELAPHAAQDTGPRRHVFTTIGTQPSTTNACARVADGKRHLHTLANR